jgi:hypothetical protein
MSSCSWYNCCIKYLFCKIFTQKNNEYVDDKYIQEPTFFNVDNIILQQGGIDLLEKQTENTIIENVDIPEQSFLDLGKTLLENIDLNTIDK